MPRVLMLARHFPPVGGAGVHRTLGSVRHLPAHGYEPVVVTGTPVHGSRWEPRDDGLLAAVPESVPVHRVVPRPAPAHTRLGRLRGAPPPWVRSWVEGCVELGRQAGGGAHLIYASCAPYETALAAAALSDALGIPWVADLEDPWAVDDMRVHPTRWHRAADLRGMRRALAGAAAVVTTAPEAAARIRAALPELAARVTVSAIPIGFDSREGPPAVPPHQGRFRIVHSGSLHTDLGERLRQTRVRRRLLGGGSPGFDVRSRSHVFLAEAIAGDRALAGAVELHLAGELTGADLAAIRGHGFVHAHGLLPYEETLSLVRSADLLFLPMYDLPPGARAGLIPFKTFDYLASGRPILAGVPDGDVRDMLGPVAHAHVVRPTDIGALAAAIHARVRASAAAGGREPDAPAPPQYERSACVARIAEVLDGVLEDPGVRRARRTSRRGR